jgi:hypothetical protein
MAAAKMLANNTELLAESPPSRQGKVRLCTIASLDGRTIAARRARELVAAFEAELGGVLTAGQRLAVERAAQLVALAEDARSRRLGGDMAVSLEDLVRVDNAASRAVRQLRIGAAAAPAPSPSPADYLASRAGRSECGVPPDDKTDQQRSRARGEASGEGAIE